jgi:hypothetical protein
MKKIYYTFIFICLICLLVWLYWYNPSDEKAFCFFLSIITIQIALYKNLEIKKKLKYTN